MRESLRRLAWSDEECGRGGGAAGMRRARVELLDGEYINVDVHRKAKGVDLLSKVCQSLDLLEEDYFGLLHQQRGDPRVWVDPNRRLSKTFRMCQSLDLLEEDYFGLLHQQRGDPRVWVDPNRRLSKTFRNEPWDVRLAVKFYPPEPSELQDDATRYQISLAVRRDLLEGRLSCSSITQALLASYVAQAELGDRAERAGARTLADLRAAPLHALTPDLEEKVDELYRKHRGQTPAEAELNYLENAKKLALYGAELHCARDSEEVDIVLAVCAGGISVYRDGVLMNRFPWAKITKIAYNKKQFLLKLRPSEFDQFETQLVFRLPATRACKKLWKCSVENHIFFRREAPVNVCRVAGFPALGSRKSSCRRTLRQLRAVRPPATGA